MTALARGHATRPHPVRASSTPPDTARHRPYGAQGEESSTLGRAHTTTGGDVARDGGGTPFTLAAELR
jgi:hypothetical protein